ncbi:Fructose-bisphosphate aldolase [Granulibacter bethesdensis]|nr:Fructose-bisphosphate aldolase [Granulibacter bethesdensis]
MAQDPGVTDALRWATSATKPKQENGPMRITPVVKSILDKYESDNPGTKTNLARILMEGRLGGTGKLVILPVDQGFEHGPARSFAPNPPAYDPHYHFDLAIEAGLSAYAAPLGMIEAGAGTYAGSIPLILKVNSSNSLAVSKDQAVTGTVADALRLGCSAIGFTIYPGSEYAFDQMEELRELAEEAKSAGLAVVVWSYPRGPELDKKAETALDICAYAAHMAALLGAHIIKVKPPTDAVSLPAAQKTYETQNIDRSTLAKRVEHVMQASFAGRRIVVFSGGETTGTDQLLDTIRGLRDGGANGSIIGRNTFQRPRAEALELLGKIIDIFQNKA